VFFQKLSIRVQFMKMDKNCGKKPDAKTETLVSNEETFV
jgi:hypothetical protein